METNWNQMSIRRGSQSDSNWASTMEAEASVPGLTAGQGKVKWKVPCVWSFPTISGEVVGNGTSLVLQFASSEGSFALATYLTWQLLWPDGGN